MVQDAQPTIVPADTAWMLISTALVLLMTPALAFFYGGLVRSKNSLNTMMMSFVALGAVGLTWALVAYSEAFADGSGFVGSFQNAFLSGVGVEPKGTIPHLLFMAYQGTFAIITAALISGAIVERMRFGPYVAFLCIWTIVVYGPVAHWVWGGGWLGKLGTLDFAGGTVVHINAGISALVAATVLGRGKTTPARPSQCITCRLRCSGPASVRLVWVQRRERAGGEWYSALAFTNTFLAPWPP
jgi:Amt family ammonium transporter